MRKMLVLFSALFVVMLLAAPASAQRDPFDPVIDTTAEGQAADGQAADGDAQQGDGDAGTDPTGPPGADGVPNTGADPEPWLVAAYALIAFGAGALALSKTLSPTR